ncbi:2-hydroxy-3-oxopropionate reductase [Candidatus Burkholderia crenata]|nr:2-hydroxy-3-oxopropionate reductase [Candidatus Burkholderia crenata]
MDVGFIGLGNMGGAMALNALKAGHTVRVWNCSPDAAKALAGQGARVVASADEAFAGDAVFSMLADDSALRAVLLDSGLLERAPKGLVHVNMATISVVLCEELVSLHEKHGVAYDAAPVLGRPDVAAVGKLNIVAVGADDAIACVQPIFDVIGQKTWRVGTAPQHANVFKNVFKLAANFMLASAIETTAEAASLMTGHGIDPHAFLDVITNTLFPGPVYQGYGRMIADNRYELALFKARLGLKDVRLALVAGDAVNVSLPGTSLVRDNLIDVLAQGDGDKDLAMLGKVAARRAGKKV